MNKDILWETHYEITVGEQMNAVTKLYQEPPATQKRMKNNTRLFFISLLILNILAFLFFKNYLPHWIFLKLIGFNILYIVLCISFIRLRYYLSIKKSDEKTKDWNDINEKERTNNIPTFLHLRHNGIHAKEFFFSWSEIGDYYIDEDWLFITSQDYRIFAIPLTHLIEEEIEDLLKIIEQKTQLKLRTKVL